MSFAAPLWLIALVPWAAVAVWMFWGRRRRVRVPFLELWRVPPPPTPPPKRKKWELPPLGAVLVLLAMLLALLASARPRLHVRLPGGVRGEPLTIVVDRGLSMSGRGSDGRYRFVEAADRIDAQVKQAVGVVGPVDLVVVPPPQEFEREPRRTDAGNFATLVRQIKPTAADARAPLRAAVAARLIERPGPVVVLTDQVLEAAAADERVIQVPPESALRNVGIVRVAARASPTPQVMVTVRQNEATATVNPPSSARLRVTSDGATAERAIELPGPGGAVTTFIDLKSLGRTVRAELAVGDGQNEPNDVEADDAGWLVREGSWPRVEPRAALPAELRRMIDVYAAARPADESSRRVLVVTKVEDLPAGGSGVVVATGEKTKPTGAAAGIQVRDHPITRRVAGWEQALHGGLVPAPPRLLDRFTPVVTTPDDAAAVAVRESSGGGRQVWIGFDPAGPWARSADYVVFWANVFEWAGQDSVEGEDGSRATGVKYVSHPVGQVDGRWEPINAGADAMPITDQPLTPAQWPGLYRSSDGLLRAFNVPAEALAESKPADGGKETATWQSRLEALNWSNLRPTFDLSPWLLVAAAAAIAGAALAWRRRPVPARRPVLPDVEPDKAAGPTGDRLTVFATVRSLSDG